MQKSDLERSLLETTGGKPWISKRKLKAWYGKGDAKLERFIQGIDYRKDGNRIEFFVPDVAIAVLKERIRV